MSIIFLEPCHRDLMNNLIYLNDIVCNIIYLYILHVFKLQKKRKFILIGVYWSLQLSIFASDLRIMHVTVY